MQSSTTLCVTRSMQSYRAQLISSATALSHGLSNTLAVATPNLERCFTLRLDDRVPRRTIGCQKYSVSSAIYIQSEAWGVVGAKYLPVTWYSSACVILVPASGNGTGAGRP